MKSQEIYSHLLKKRLKWLVIFIIGLNANSAAAAGYNASIQKSFPACTDYSEPYCTESDRAWAESGSFRTTGNGILTLKYWHTPGYINNEPLPVRILVKSDGHSSSIVYLTDLISGLTQIDGGGQGSDDRVEGYAKYKATNAGHVYDSNYSLIVGPIHGYNFAGYYQREGTTSVELKFEAEDPNPSEISKHPDKAGSASDNQGTSYHPSSEVCPGLPVYSVNTSYLNLVIEDMDFGCRSRGLDQSMRRVWSMRPSVSGMFGNGWSFEFESTLLADPLPKEDSILPSVVTISLGSGQIVEYKVSSQSALNESSIRVNYTRTTSGIGPLLSAVIDKTSGLGVYTFYDKHTKIKKTYTPKPGKPVQGRYRYRLAEVSDRNDNAIRLTYGASGLLTALTDATGRKTQFEYNAKNRVIKMTAFTGESASYQYDAAGNLVGSVDLAGNIIKYTYDAQHYPLTLSVAGKKTTFTYATNARGARYVSTVTEPDGAQRQYEFWYDVARITDPGGGVYYYSNNHGYTSQITNPLGQTTRIVHNAQFLPTQITDPLGRVSLLEYDANGNLTKLTDEIGKITKFAYDNFWNLKKTINALGQTSLYEYDSRHNLIKKISPMGKVTAYRFDQKGQITGITQPDGSQYVLTYDAHGNLNSLVDPLGKKTTLVSDAVGLNLVETSDPRGYKTQFDWDSNRRLTAIHRADNTSELFNRNCCSLTSIENRAGQITQFKRDSLYRLTGLIDPLGNVSSFGYNVNGDLISATDPLGQTVTTSYDAIHRPVLITDPLGGKIATWYDAVGNLVGLQDERNHATTMTYDNRDLLAGIKDPLGRTTSSYTRDGLGRLISVKNARGNRVAFTYDADGQLTTKRHNGLLTASYSRDVNGQLTAVTDVLGVKSFGYDAVGRVKTIAYPDGRKAVFSYDAAGNLIAIMYPTGLVVKYVYDELNRVVGVNFAGNSLNLSYDAAGDLVQEKRSNGVVSNYTYDAARQLTGIRHQKGTNIIANLVYTRNEAGHITQESGKWPIYPRYAAATTTATYNEANAILTANNDVFTHDLDGNLTRVTGSRRLSATYDPENRPKSITRGTTVTNYVYDGLGNRVQSKTGTATQTYYHDAAGRLLTAIDSATNSVTHYIHAGGRLIASGTPGKAYFFYHHNQIGSTLALTNQAGNVVAAFAYDPFGKVLARSGTVKTPFTFVGAYGVMEEAGDLFFMRHRYYDAVTGRFIQRDPIGFAGGQTNLYAYAGNEPINKIDPSGMAILGVTSDWDLLKTSVGLVVEGVGGAIIIGGSAPLVGTGLFVVGLAITIDGFIDIRGSSHAIANQSAKKMYPNAIIRNAKGIWTLDKYYHDEVFIHLDDYQKREIRYIIRGLNEIDEKNSSCLIPK